MEIFVLFCFLKQFKNRVLWSHTEKFSFISCVSAPNTSVFVLCGASASNPSLKINTWPSLYLAHSSFFFFLTLSYLLNLGLLIIWDLLNWRKISLLSWAPGLILLQFSASFTRLMSNCVIYLLSWLGGGLLESEGDSLEFCAEFWASL